MARQFDPSRPGHDGPQYPGELPDAPQASQQLEAHEDHHQKHPVAGQPNQILKFERPDIPPFADNLERPSSPNQSVSSDDMRNKSKALVRNRWPPKGLSQRSQLSQERATALVCHGALLFEGLVLQAKHTTTQHLRFYATVAAEGAKADAVATEYTYYAPPDMSLVLLHSGGHALPWDTLEQPSMTNCFGPLPGTVTLNEYVNTVNRHVRPTKCAKYAVVPRKPAHVLVLQRLHFLQTGLDYDLNGAEETLFTQFVCDPKWVLGAKEGLDRQIGVLIAALDNPAWTDFSDSSMRVLARLFDSHDVDVEQHFCYQLLLSVELYLRLEKVTREDNKHQKQAILTVIPEKVAYDLALAQIWLTKMRFEPLDTRFLRHPTIFHITALTKINQKEKLLQFATKMKWPNISDVENMLKEAEERIVPLECRSPYSSSWISGTIFPGSSASFLIMRSLIDCDGKINSEPPGFGQKHWDFGFQYRGSTYWYWESIMGRVMGAFKNVEQDYGWIGPCPQSEDLMELHTLLVPCAPPVKYLTKSRVRNMAARSAALGPQTDRYPVNEFVLPLPDFTNIVDWVELKKLAFKPHSKPASDAEPTKYHAAVVFSVDGQTIPIRLRHDVSFIYIPPCKGRHVLFWDYSYETIDVDSLLDLRSWNGVMFWDKKPPTGTTSSTGTSSSGKTPAWKLPFMKKWLVKTKSNSDNATAPTTAKKVTEVESVLVVEAYGSTDNEVLARAWASYVGFSTIVANVRETCIACSIRAAYAAAVPMVILNEGQREGRRRRA